MLTPDGKIKLRSEMTPEERVADTLRHFPKMLNRWKGGFARFWSYTISLHSFAIRVERAGVRGNLVVACHPDHICGPVSWYDANIEIIHEPGVGYVVQDLAVGVRIVGGPIYVAENVKPVYVGGPYPTPVPKNE